MAAIRGTFTATGVSASSFGHSADLILGGTFSAQVQLEVAINDAAGAKVWVPVGNSLNNPGMGVLPNGAIGTVIREWRANCTNYTSGTVVYQLGTCAFEDNIDLV